MLKRIFAIAASILLITSAVTVVMPVERAAAAAKGKIKSNVRHVRERAAPKMQRGMEGCEGGRQDRRREVAEVL